MSTNNVKGYVITTEIRIDKQTTAKIDPIDHLSLIPLLHDVAGRVTANYVPSGSILWPKHTACVNLERKLPIAYDLL